MSARPMVATLLACAVCWIIGTYWVSAGVALAFLAGALCTEKGWLNKRRSTG